MYSAANAGRFSPFGLACFWRFAGDWRVPEASNYDGSHPALYDFVFNVVVLYVLDDLQLANIGQFVAVMLDDSQCIIK